MTLTINGGQTFVGLSTFTLAKQINALWLLSGVTVDDVSWTITVYCVGFGSGWQVAMTRDGTPSACTWSLALNDCSNVFSSRPTFQNGVTFTMATLEPGFCLPNYYESLTITW